MVSQEMCSNDLKVLCYGPEDEDEEETGVFLSRGNLKLFCRSANDRGFQNK